MLAIKEANLLSGFSLNKVLVIIIHWEFFTPVFARGFSLEFEWQQVLSDIQDSS